jgi:trigger factor
LDDLGVDKPEPTVTDADVDRTIERLQRQKGAWQAVERPAATGDRVIVDFEGTLGGVPIEGGKAEKLGIVIGEGRMLADFEANLTGIAAGDSKSFNVRFPADYYDAKLRDAEVAFAVRAHEVAALELPAVDADFVSGYGVVSGDLAEFRRLVRENLEREAAAKVQAEVRRQLMEHLLARNPVEVPTVMVAREAAGLQAESMRNLGLKDAKDAPALGAYEEVARRRVRLGLIMGALIREHDLRIDQAGVERKLDELCRPYEQPEEVRKLYLQNEQLMAQVENSVMEEQVMAWLLERAQLRPKAVALTDLMGA